MPANLMFSNKNDKNDTEILTLLMLFIERCLQIRQSSGRCNKSFSETFTTFYFSNYMCSLSCTLVYVLYVFEVSFMFFGHDSLLRINTE